MFFVAGITGKVGGAAARLLLEEGHGVRALVRNPARAAEWVAKGVDVRQGDLNDAEALAAALEGVEGAFVMMPPNFAPQPGYPEAKAIVAALAEALDKAKPARVVALSSVGSEKTSGLGLITTTHLLEEGLKDLPCPTALVRAGSFIENALGGLDTAEATGVYYSFYQPIDRAVPTIATVDIGAEVAKLLTGSWSGKKIVELGSPVTADEMAAGMGEVLGREVKAQAIPREQWAAIIEGFGMPAGTTWAYEEMLDSVNSGWIDFGVAGTESVAGTTTPAEVFAAARKV
jgi:uncharacterized protein YbjT (DUF2867 family)